MTRNWIIVGLFAVAVAFGIGGERSGVGPDWRPPASDANGILGDLSPLTEPAVLRAGASPGGPFTLVDHTGLAVSDRDFRGKYMLITFGYTSCPDICPTIMGRISAALDLLGERTGNLQPIFVTLDPERDGPDRLASYVDFFHPAFIGLTGSQEQIAAVAERFLVHFEKVYETGAESDPNAYYSIDHSAFIYLMGPDGNYLDVFAHRARPEDLVRDIARHMDALM